MNAPEVNYLDLYKYRSCQYWRLMSKWCEQIYFIHFLLDLDSRYVKTSLYGLCQNILIFYCYVTDFKNRYITILPCPWEQNI